MTQHRLLFICRDNTCRSVLAEAAMRLIIAQEDRLDDFLLASRSLSAGGGAKASRLTLGAAARAGVDLSNFRSRPFCEADFRNFELVLAMDTATRKKLLDLAPVGLEHRVHLLLDFAPWMGTEDVPDPTFEGDAAADDVFEILQIAARSLIEVIDQSSSSYALSMPAMAPVSAKLASVR
jgi:protein-tyrosine phosphatase